MKLSKDVWSECIGFWLNPFSVVRLQRTCRYLHDVFVVHPTLIRFNTLSAKFNSTQSERYAEFKILCENPKETAIFFDVIVVHLQFIENPYHFLRVAGETNRLDVMRFILEHIKTNLDRSSYLHYVNNIAVWACTKNWADVFKLLVQYGANDWDRFFGLTTWNTMPPKIVDLIYAKMRQKRLRVSFLETGRPIKQRKT